MILDIRRYAETQSQLGSRNISIIGSTIQVNKITQVLGGTRVTLAIASRMFFTIVYQRVSDIINLLLKL